VGGKKEKNKTPFEMILLKSGPSAQLSFDGVWLCMAGIKTKHLPITRWEVFHL
jgi:hypothetical protein